MPECPGTAADHCCYLEGGKVCQFLEENTVPGRRWACGLLRELGDWPSVYADARYQREVKPVIDRMALPGFENCNDWPMPGKICATCGARG